MTEKPIFTDRPKLKEVTLPVDTVKELADLIPKPDNKFHYRMDGDWQENRDVFRVNEGDGVFSDYTFPDKSDMGKTQFATRKTYAKELNMFGNIVDKDVQFERKTGKWKKLNLVQTIKSKFHKGDNIPGQVVEENGKFVLHTLEDKRPVGDSVKEAEMTTLQDAKVELGLKYTHLERALSLAKDMNMKLAKSVAVAEAEAATLTVQLRRANERVAALTAQLRVQEAQAAQQARESQPGYTGPIYNKPKPEDVVEGVIIE